MKNSFLTASMNIISQTNKYNEEQMEIIKYGLEGLYLTITKMIVILGVAGLLGILKEVVLLLVSYNVIRAQAFGIHATKSIYCLISSMILFVGGAILCMYTVIPFWIMMVGCVICDVCLLCYAPADTYKRPIVNKKKRKRFKFVSFLLGIIYTVLIVVYKDSSSVNYLFYGIIEATLMILPITYKIFGLPYNNYKRYDSGV